MAQRREIDWVLTAPWVPDLGIKGERHRHQHYLPDICDLTSNELGRQMLRKMTTGLSMRIRTWSSARLALTEVEIFEMTALEAFARYPLSRRGKFNFRTFSLGSWYSTNDMVEHIVLPIAISGAVEPRLPVGLNITKRKCGGTLPPCGRENSPYRHPSNKESISTPELGGVFCLPAS
jgi:hypothetical protein